MDDIIKNHLLGAPCEANGGDAGGDEEQEGIRITALTRAVAARLPVLLRKLGVSRRELAERAGVSYSLITGIIGEERNVTLEVLLGITTALGITVDQLLGLLAVDEEELEGMIAAQKKLEEEMRQVMCMAAEAQSPDERQELLKRAQELNVKLMGIGNAIERSKFLLHRGKPLVITDVSSKGDVRLPSGATVYVKEAEENDCERGAALYCVKRGGEFAIVRRPQPSDELIGKVHTVAFPARLLKEAPVEEISVEGTGE